MIKHLDIARDLLLTPAELTENDLQSILESILSHKVDFADLFFQSSHYESWSIEDGIIRDASFNLEQGVGVRAVDGEKTGFAYSDDLILPALEQAATAARTIAPYGGVQKIQTLKYIPQSRNSLYTHSNPLASISDAQKVEFLRDIDKRARSIDPKISQVIASLTAAHSIVLVAASDGTLAADCRPMVRVNISVIAEHKGRIERASTGGGGRKTYADLLNPQLAEDFSKEAVRQALVNLEAKPAPAGVMPVVLGPGWPGVLLHEAVGHGLEGDFNRKKSSAYSGRIGQKVASELCTIVDDGTLEGRRGSLNIDDEGTPTQCTTLIENGILTGYMQDKLNAKLMNSKSTGNGRRESYAYLPMPRMTNTYMLPGKSEPDEIISSVKHGLYAVNFGGGQVDITSGKFVFNTSEAYMIENGKISHPVKGATLIGNGPEVMSKVSMVGNNMQLDNGIGVCGKDGQSVAVGLGQPTLLVDELTIGGTKL